MTSTITTPEAPVTTAVTGERADLLETLGKHRYFLRHTVQGLTDDEARLRTTASELTLGGLIKHVAGIEKGWVDFILDGPQSGVGEVDWSQDGEISPEVLEEWSAKFRLLPDETLEGVLAEYAEVARRTDELVAGIPDLDASQPLPEAPWFEAGARWSARRVFLHIVAETAQHAGHADIIRESLDGQKSMG
ncbi:DinB family protein [Pseudonocardia aurantiaca]|uniref:DinB family protein n=1 Tax=Pseudonocardia aurantiaca TaxID=75290 RepID=A0ABW4FWH6_9PSEU